MERLKCSSKKIPNFISPKLKLYKGRNRVTLYLVIFLSLLDLIFIAFIVNNRSYEDKIAKSIRLQEINNIKISTPVKTVDRNIKGINSYNTVEDYLAEIINIKSMDINENVISLSLKLQSQNEYINIIKLIEASGKFIITDFESPTEKDGEYTFKIKIEVKT